MTEEVRLTGGGGFWAALMAELRRAILTPPGFGTPPDIGMPDWER